MNTHFLYNIRTCWKTVMTLFMVQMNLFDCFLDLLNTFCFESLQFLFHSDMRQMNCFREFVPTNDSFPTCGNAIPFNMTQTQCCCGDFNALGWGDPCTKCPELSTGECYNYSFPLYPSYRYYRRFYMRL